MFDRFSGTDGEGNSGEVLGTVFLHDVCSGEEGGAGGPDIVEEDVGGGGVDRRGDGIGFGGLSFAGRNFGADLDGVGSAGEKLLAFPAAKFGEPLRDNEGVIETAGADVLADGRERDEDDFLILVEIVGNNMINKVGKDRAGGADGLVFELFDKFFKGVLTVTDSPEIIKRKVTIWAFYRGKLGRILDIFWGNGNGIFTDGTNGSDLLNYVFFTTLT